MFLVGKVRLCICVTGPEMECVAWGPVVVDDSLSQHHVLQ